MSSKDQETREALVMAIKLLMALRGRLRHTPEATWQIALAALVVLLDQHDGRYAGR